MPTYEYLCSSCGNQWEEIQKISEAALTDCPKCQTASAKRQISGGSFILKGGGWYADLYSSSGAKKPEPSGDSATAKTEGKSETKADSPATSTDSGAKGESKTAAPAPAASPATPAKAAAPTKSS